MYSHLPSPVRFREHIDGLRAWAVMAVLFFHFSLIGLPGGFAGVDVFFVISGYLMTAIVVSGHEKGHFSVWKFYVARARRILPALMVVIATLLLLGWFWLPTPDYQALGRQAQEALGFTANIYYNKKAGYFDAAAQEKWFLHTWSLAVEAQFYLLYPVFLALMWRFWSGLKALMIGLLVLFVASLALNLIVTFSKPTAAFYLLPSRSWELAAGGLVYLIASKGWASEAMRSKGFWLGWLLVIASFAFIEESMAWPGYWAILPVLGASLIILGQREDCFLTNNPVAQWLGDRSYSLYLWHWPLVVALYFAGLQSEWAWVLGFLALSLLLAHLSYRFVEVPTRSYFSAASLRKELIAIGIAAAVIWIALVSVKHVVFDNRLPSEFDFYNESTYISRSQEGCFTSGNSDNMTGCMMPMNKGRTEMKLILAGDSHSEALRSALYQWLDASLKQGLMYFGYATCPMIDGALFSSYSQRKNINACIDFNDRVKSFSYEHPGVPVVLISRTNVAFFGFGGEHKYKGKPFLKFNNLENGSDEFLLAGAKGLVRAACQIQQHNQVYLMRPIPEIGIHVPKVLSRNIMFGRGSEDIKITLEEYHARNKLVWEAQDQAAAQCGVKILNPLPYLCDDQYCYGSKNGRPLYFDDNHLSEYGSKFLVPMFEAVFKH
jgi:peptidoglycan/LPS O-acetylase OafA/YrhL